jgi:putative ABC transport system ATP-binding protein
MEIFQNLNDKGITIVMVTHEPDIAQFAKSNILFKDGKIIANNPVKDRKNATEELKKIAEPAEENSIV